MSDESHTQRILKEWTQQAVPFSMIPEQSHESALQRMMDMANAGKEDTVLDVACGPGLVTMAFAPEVKQVTGIDITPAMVDRAKQLATEKDVQNVNFETGDVTQLPYPDQSFSIVLTRYSMHHFLEPKQVIQEMLRVCRKDGVVMIVDLVLPSEKRDFYDTVERLRDPSHVKVLTLEELKGIAEDAPMRDLEFEFYKWEMELEALLKASTANSKDKETIRNHFEQDVGNDNLGLGVRKEEHDLCFAYPIVILKGIKCTDQFTN